MTISAIWKLFLMLLELRDVVNVIIKFAKEKHGDEWDKHIADGVRAYASLVAANTDEERANAKRKVADSWLKL